MSNQAERIATNIKNLEDALGSGVLEVDIGGSRTRFRSHADILDALNYWRKKASKRPLLHTVGIRTHKGLSS